MKKILLLCVIIIVTLILVGCGSDPDGNYTPTTTTQDVQTGASKSFSAYNKWLTFGTDMELYDQNDNYIGIVEERIFNWGTTFEYLDENDKLIAKAKQKVFTLYTQIVISDTDGNKIGTLEEEIIETLFSAYSIYTIYDAKHNIIAKSDKLKLLTNSIYIYGDDYNITMDQRFFSIKDTWDIEVNGEIDERMIVFIPAFINSAQSKRD